MRHIVRLTRAFRRRALTRFALVGLVFGFVTLAVGGLLAVGTTSRAIRTVDAADLTTDAWYRTSVFISQESDAMNEYLTAPDDAGLRQLSSQIGSAQPTIDWLRDHVTPGGRKRVQLVGENYRDLSSTLRDLSAAARQGNRGEAAAYGTQASTAAWGLRKLLTSDLLYQRSQLRHDLGQVGDHNRQLHDIGIYVIAVDAVLLIICAGLLLEYQRRIERHAASNRHQARHDALTGLANRRALDDELDRLVRDAGDTAQRSALLLLDLDGFKAVNDSYGHQAGDVLLREIAARLTGTVRHTDLVARLGGDEFAVLLPAVQSVEQVRAIARKLLDEIQRPVVLSGATATVTGSIGIALCPDDATDHEQLVRHADAAMYNAKRGHLGMVFHAPDLTVEVH